MNRATKDNAVANRDRFVGFAFAAAHLLLETDNSGVIIFAAGARCGLVSGALSDLVGHSLFEFSPPEEHSLLRILFQRLIKKGKLDLTHIVLRSLNGNRFSAFFGACRLPNHPDRCFLSVSIRGQAAGRGGGASGSRSRQLSAGSGEPPLYRQRHRDFPGAVDGVDRRATRHQE